MSFISVSKGISWRKLLLLLAWWLTYILTQICMWSSVWLYVCCVVWGVCVCVQHTHALCKIAHYLWLWLRWWEALHYVNVVKAHNWWHTETGRGKWSSPSLSAVLPHVCSESLDCCCSSYSSAPLCSPFFSFTSLSPLLFCIWFPRTGKGDESEARTQWHKYLSWLIVFWNGEKVIVHRQYSDGVKLENGAWAIEHLANWKPSVSVLPVAIHFFSDFLIPHDW